MHSDDAEESAAAWWASEISIIVIDEVGRLE